MKDQLELILKCEANNIPHLCLMANDRLAVDAIHDYRKCCVSGGCSEEFTDELSNIQDNFFQYAIDGETNTPTKVNGREACKNAGSIPTLTFIGSDMYALIGVRSYIRSCEFNKCDIEFLSKLREIEAQFELYREMKETHIPD